MADDNNNINDDDTEDDEAVERDEAADASGDAPGDEHEPEEDVSRQERLRGSWSRQDRNRSVLGRLVVHFAERDVVVVLDGDAALRLISAFDGDRAHLDIAHPDASSARNGWFGLRMNRVLALNWVPGLPTPEPATAVVDPVAA